MLNSIFGGKNNNTSGGPPKPGSQEARDLEAQAHEAHDVRQDFYDFADNVLAEEEANKREGHFPRRNEPARYPSSASVPYTEHSVNKKTTNKDGPPRPGTLDADKLVRDAQTRHDYEYYAAEVQQQQNLSRHGAPTAPGALQLGGGGTIVTPSAPPLYPELSAHQMGGGSKGGAPDRTRVGGILQAPGQQQYGIRVSNDAGQKGVVPQAPGRQQYDTDSRPETVHGIRQAPGKQQFGSGIRVSNDAGQREAVPQAPGKQQYGSDNRSEIDGIRQAPGENQLGSGTRSAPRW